MSGVCTVQFPSPEVLLVDIFISYNTNVIILKYANSFLFKFKDFNVSYTSSECKRPNYAVQVRTTLLGAVKDAVNTPSL